jgi:hypothetical protein
VIGARVPRAVRSPRIGRGPLRPRVRTRPRTGGIGLRRRGLLRELLVLGAALAAIAAVLVFLLGLRPPAPQGPQPHLAIRKLATPHVLAPAPSGPGTPNVGPPSLPDPGPSSGPSSGGSAPAAHGPGIEHRTEILHHHHLRFIFVLDWEWAFVGAAAVLVGFLVTRRRSARARGWPRRTGPTVLIAILLALAACLFLFNSIIVPDQSLGPEHAHFVRRTTKTLDDGTKVITDHWHVHHLHPPIRIYVVLLLLGVGSGVLATKQAQEARVARRFQRRAKADRLDEGV